MIYTHVIPLCPTILWFGIKTMMDLLTTIASVLGTLGGFELIKYLLNRQTNARIADAQADGSEFAVLKETIQFLQEQLREKEKRFAEQTDLVRQLNTENLRLTAENGQLKAERSLKLCERRGCQQREPESGY